MKMKSTLYFSNKRCLAALKEKDYLHTLYITFFPQYFPLNFGTYLIIEVFFFSGT